MSTVHLTLPKPHTGQLEIVSNRKRFNAVCCGRRWGKTLIGGNAAIYPALQGEPVAWFAPNYKYLMVPWRYLRLKLKPIISSVNKQEKRIELITGGSIDFWSLDDPDAGRSYKYKRAIVDEAAMARHLEAAWNDSIRPTLADLRGDAWFFSTPKGLNFFWTLFNRGQDELEPEWGSWKMPTITNPYIHPDEIEAARKGMPERSFEQEFLAEFKEDGGGVFRGVREVIDTTRRENSPPQPGRVYTLGVDLARVEDFTVLSVMDDNGKQCYFDRFNQISWERQINAICEVAGRYKASVVQDSTGVGDPIFERLRAAGLRVEAYGFTNASKEALIENLAMLIENRRVSLMDVNEQTSELLAYQYELTPSRNVRMNAPQGMHDDTVIALALSAWHMKQRVVTTGYKRGTKAGGFT